MQKLEHRAASCCRARDLLAPFLQRAAQFLQAERHRHGGGALVGDATGEDGRPDGGVADRDVEDVGTDRVGTRGKPHLAADAEAIRHHGRDELERVRRDGGDRLHRHFREHGVEHLPQQGAGIGHDEVLIDQVGDPDRAALGERMVFAHGDAGLEVEGRDLLQPAAHLHGIADDDVDIAAQQDAGKCVGVRDRDLKIHVRIVVTEFLQEAGQEFARHGLVDPEPHGAFVGAVQQVDLGAGGVELVDRLAHPVEQGFAGGGQAQSLAVAGEQLDLELLLQELDLAADGGGRDMDAVRGQPKRAVARDLVEISQRRRIREIRQKTQRHRVWTGPGKHDCGTERRLLRRLRKASWNGSRVAGLSAGAGAEGPMRHPALDIFADRVGDHGHDRHHDQAGEDKGDLEAGGRAHQQEADAVVGGDGLGDHRADEGERHGDLQAGEEIGHGAGHTDLGQDLPLAGAERAHHVFHLGLDGRDAGRHVHHDGEQCQGEGSEHRGDGADAAPQDEERDQRHLRDRVERDQQRIDAAIDL